MALSDQIKVPAQVKGAASSSIPTTLGATTFSGNITTNGFLVRGSNNSSNALCGGTSSTQSNGAAVVAYGASNGGHVEYTVSSTAGSRHKFFDKNAAEELRIDENGIQASLISGLTTNLRIAGGVAGAAGKLEVNKSLSVTDSGTFTDPGDGRGFFNKGLQIGGVSGNAGPGSSAFGIWATDTVYNQNVPSGVTYEYSIAGTAKFAINSGGVKTNVVSSISGAMQVYSGNSSGSTKLSGGNLIGNNTGAELHLYGTAGTYPGAYQDFAPLISRAASTAYGVCPRASGGFAKIEIMTNLTGAQRGVTVDVDTAGTLTITGDAIYVNSSSPASGEIGIYETANVIYFKPGSGQTTLKAAFFAKLGVA